MSEIIFRQLFDARSSTYTYLLGDRSTGDAIVIDPVFEQFRRDGALLDELELKARYVLDTHVHADHVTAAWLFRTRRGARYGVAKTAGVHGVDQPLEHGDVLALGAHRFEVRATPGHTDGCLSFVAHDHSRVFTGDSLMIRAAGRADFQAGDARSLYRSVREQLFALPDDCLVFPAHDYLGRTATSIREERRHNPRMGDQISEDDCVGYMANLGLPHPNQMQIAVPANLRGGEPSDPARLQEDPRWAPLTYTFAGFWEVDARWVEEHGGEVTLVDVRERDEIHGELGHIEGIQAIPLGQLGDAIPSISRDRPVVTVCRSGSRSAQAAVLFQRAGHVDVANLTGGMLRWRALGLPVVGGDQPAPPADGAS